MVRVLASHHAMWPGFDSRIRRHMWVELVLYSAPRGFSPGTPVFPSPQESTFGLLCVNFLLSVYSVLN